MKYRRDLKAIPILKKNGWQVVLDPKDIKAGRFYNPANPVTFIKPLEVEQYRKKLPRYLELSLELTTIDDTSGVFWVIRELREARTYIQNVKDKQKVLLSIRKYKHLSEVLKIIIT